MRIGLIGIGQAGGKLVDTFLEQYKDQTAPFIRGCLAVNSARQDLQGLDYVPEDNRLLIGEAMVKGNGVGADNRKGREVMDQHVTDVLAEIDSMPLHEIDAFVVAAALGGGTGSGGLPVLAKELRERYTEPVYGLGVLPSTEEGQIYTVNAARSLESCVDATDNLMLFDNDAWSRGDGSLEEWYRELNQNLVTRFGTLLAAGEVDEAADVGESVVDASEVINTLDCGGISSVGHATADLDSAAVNPGLLSRFTGGPDIDRDEATNRMRSLTEQAVNGQLTIPADIESTERALVVFSGPRDFLTRRGMEQGRSYVETQTECMEVRGGDYPRETPAVSATVLLSGLYAVPRIRELQEIAVEASNQIDEIRSNREDRLDELLREDEAGEIESLL